MPRPGAAGPPPSGPPSPGPPSSGPDPPAADDTRSRIIAAALATVGKQGIVGTSARSIARTGDFNQALIFYHFGSVDHLLVAASQADSERRSALYADALRDVQTLPDLVAVARRLHDQEAGTGSVAVLTQLLAGAANSPDLAVGVRLGFEPWMALLRAALARVLDDGPFDGVVSTDDLSFAIASMFLGMELITSLTPGDTRDASVLDSLDVLATLGDSLLTGPLAGPVAKLVRRKQRKESPATAQTKPRARAAKRQRGVPEGG